MIQTAPYKTRLEQELTELQKELIDLGIHNPEVQEDWIAIPEKLQTSEADANVAADRTEDWDERRATIAPLETRYNNLVRALQKIEDGTYGICEVSGAEIETQRLDANPAARTCKAHLEDEANLPK